MRTLLALFWLTAIVAGQESAFDNTQRAFEDARTAEKAAAKDLAARIAAARDAEKALREHAEKQVRVAAEQAARLGAVEAKIGKTYNERMRVSVDVARLHTEAALLRKWYNAIAAGTTSIPVALRVAGLQLGVLHKTGAIAPRRTSFATAHELQRYLADVKARLTAAGNRETARKDALNRELAALKLRWANAIRGTGGPVHVKAPALDRWIKEAARVHEARRVLADRRRAVASRHSALMRVAHTHSPPVLALVSIRAPHLVYEAAWAVDGKREEARKVDKTMRALNAKVEKLDADIRTMEAKQRALHAQRLALATAIQRDGERILPLAIKYADAIWNKEVAKVVIDVSVTLVASAATGGVGAIATQSKQLSMQLEKRLAHTKALADAAGEVVPDRMYRMLLHDGAHLTSDPLKRMSQAQTRSGGLIKKYVEAAESLARREGRDVAAASRRAQLEVHKVLDRIDMQLPLREQEKRLAELYKVAEKAARMPKVQRVAASYRRALYTHTSRSPGDLLGPKDIDKESKNIVIGDVLAGGVSAVGGTALRQRLVNPDLSGAKALRGMLSRSNLVGALRGQAVGLVAGAAGTTAKVYFTRRFQGEANEAIGAFWQLYAELAAREEILRRAVREDRVLRDAIVHATKMRGLLERDRVTLQKPRSLGSRRIGYVWNPDGILRARLEFSHVLGRAPVVKLGAVTLTVKPDGGKTPTRIWFAETPTKRGSPGTHRLAVSLGEGAAWTSLDANPASRAYTVHAVANLWRDWEKGADKHHAITFDFEIAKAVAAIHSYDKALKEHGDRGEVLYGAGKPGDTGWGGMDKSVREAHRRVGAKETGDPHGHWWMAGGRLGLPNGGTHAVGGPAHRFAEHLLRRAAAGKTMTAKERAYHKQAITALYAWYRGRDAWYNAARVWMDRGAMFARIDADANKKLWAENKAARDKAEALLRKMNAPLPEFKE